MALSPDILLTVGTVLIAWLCGLEVGAQFMIDKLPDPVMAVAINLGELHNAHEEAKQHQVNLEAAKYRLSKRLADHIEQLKRLFTLE